MGSLKQRRIVVWEKHTEISSLLRRYLAGVDTSLQESHAWVMLSGPPYSSVKRHRRPQETETAIKVSSLRRASPEPRRTPWNTTFMAFPMVAATIAQCLCTTNRQQSQMTFVQRLSQLLLKPCYIPAALIDRAD